MALKQLLGTETVNDLKMNNVAEVTETLTENMTDIDPVHHTEQVFAVFYGFKVFIFMILHKNEASKHH